MNNQDLYVWDGAKKHLDEVIEEYKKLIGMPGVNPIFGLAYLNSLLTRYNQGERSEELLEEMQTCE